VPGKGFEHEFSHKKIMFSPVYLNYRIILKYIEFSNILLNNYFYKETIGNDYRYGGKHGI
jgi:hypothetical protein